jgi:hypothetical protein
MLSSSSDGPQTNTLCVCRCKILQSLLTIDITWSSVCPKLNPSSPCVLSSGMYVFQGDTSVPTEAGAQAEEDGSNDNNCIIAHIVNSASVPNKSVIIQQHSPIILLAFVCLSALSVMHAKPQGCVASLKRADALTFCCIV